VRFASHGWYDKEHIHLYFRWANGCDWCCTIHRIDASVWQKCPPEGVMKNTWVALCQEKATRLLIFFR
jgi:hypothetical protein